MILLASALNCLNALCHLISIGQIICSWLMDMITDFASLHFAFPECCMPFLHVSGKQFAAGFLVWWMACALHCLNAWHQLTNIGVITVPWLANMVKDFAGLLIALPECAHCQCLVVSDGEIICSWPVLCLCPLHSELHHQTNWSAVNLRVVAANASAIERRWTCQAMFHEKAWSFPLFYWGTACK